MKFKKGHSGNPKGKCPGTLNKSTKEIKELIKSIVDFVPLIKRLAVLANRGNVPAMKILLEYAYGKPICNSTDEGDENDFRSITVHIIDEADKHKEAS